VTSHQCCALSWCVLSRFTQLLIVNISICLPTHVYTLNQRRNMWC